jgi:hypothetical protein
VSENLTVKEIVTKYLKDNGYGGLFDPGNGDPCGCRLDDLMPCAEYGLECVAGYEVACRADCASEVCDEYRRGEQGVWCIQRDKPDTEREEASDE